MTNVLVLEGFYRNVEVENIVFEMVKPPKNMKKGIYVTVNSQGQDDLPVGKIKIKIPSHDHVVISEDEITPVAAAKPELSDDAIIETMRKKFSILDDMTYATVNGIVKGLIVTGPPGVGKSYGVEKIIRQVDNINKAEYGRAEYGIEKGSATPINFYKMLFTYSKKGSVLVLDDSDSILFNEDCLNMLKAVIDTGRSRRISYRSESKILEEAGVPTSFDFEGSIIFISNLDFCKSKSSKIGAHLEAIVSRCHYLDMGIKGVREKFLRCRQIVQDGMLDDYEFGEDQKEAILTYIDDFKHDLRELSLRMVIKIADLCKMDPENWRVYADNTCRRNGS